MDSEAKNSVTRMSPRRLPLSPPNATLDPLRVQQQLDAFGTDEMKYGNCQLKPVRFPPRRPQLAILGGAALTEIANRLLGIHDCTSEIPVPNVGRGAGG